jgi:hypothetical protein
MRAGEWRDLKESQKKATAPFVVLQSELKQFSNRLWVSLR